MNKLFTRLALIILAGILLVGYILPVNKYLTIFGLEIPKKYTSKDFKLGLDLQGGVELDYKVDLEEAKKAEDYTPQKEKQILEGLKGIIDKRIETLNINDSVITTANYAGEQHIIVQIPLKGKNPEEDKLNIERAKKAIGKVMKIVFKERRTEVTEKDLKDREDIATKSLKELKESKYNFYVTAAKTKDTYPDIEIGNLELDIKGLEQYFTIPENKIKKGLVDNVIIGKGIGKLVGEEGKWIINIKDILEKKGKKELVLNYIFILSKPSDWIPAKGKGKDGKLHILNDTYFVKSSVQYNEAFQPMVELSFNNEGAKIFGDLSTRLVNKQMAIFVGGDLLTAPNINEPILGGKAVITGDYTPKEANKLAQDINTGVVPAPIYLTSEKSIDSKLGASSLDKLIIAGLTGFLLIFIFLIYTYRLSGFLASISLVIYVLIILVVVKFLGITLTLASIAGLILSIGMAIDANILIFERIIDELKSGSQIINATKIGFKKSWSAIWDSNITGLIVAIILFIFGINMIKGFGLMLALGIIVSLFSVMKVSKVLILLAAEKSKNKINFIGK